MHLFTKIYRLTSDLLHPYATVLILDSYTTAIIKLMVVPIIQSLNFCLHKLVAEIDKICYPHVE